MAKINSMPVEQQEALTLNPGLGGHQAVRGPWPGWQGSPSPGTGPQLPLQLSMCEDWDRQGCTGHFVQHQLPQRDARCSW